MDEFAATEELSSGYYFAREFTIRVVGVGSGGWELLQIKFCNILVSHMRRFDLIVVVVPCFAFSHMRHLGTTITKVIVGFPISCLGFLYHNLRRRSFPEERCNIIQTYQLSL